MPATEPHRRTPPGLLPDKPTPRLYDRTIEVLPVRHDARRTEEAYVHWIRRSIEFHRHRHPRQLRESDANRFLTHLAVKEHVAASTRNQALSAVLFLYEHVLEQPLDRIEGVVRPRRPKRLPVVLTVDEVWRVMAHLIGDEWLIAMLRYGGGLRLLEALRLRVKDLDLERGEITVREGKGDKDPVTTMPRAVIQPLQEHLRRAQAIHQQDLADGYDIRTVQELLGHSDVKTTMIDTHVLNRGGRGVRSPADAIGHRSPAG
jgi:site-specific recombinase XerD